MNSSLTSAILFVCSLIIAVGIAPSPLDIIQQTWEHGNLPVLLFLLVFVQLSTLTPLALGTIRIATSARFQPSIASLLSHTVVFFGMAATLLAAAISGVGSVLMLALGTSYTCAIASSLSLFAMSPHTRMRTLFSMCGLLIATAGSIWSIQTVPSIILQATSLAKTAPFCLGRHTSQHSPVTKFSDLRGFSFYSTGSGYKDSSRWFFHGILIVGTGNNRQYYGWSPRIQEFFKIERERSYIIPLRNSCKPTERFFDTLYVL